MLIRIFGAALMAFCGIYAARMLNLTLKATLDESEALLALVRFVRSQIECFSMPMPQIFERCPDELLLCCGYTGKEFKTPSELELFISDGECAKLAKEFCSQIGRGYRDEQLSLCDYYAERLEQRREALAAAIPARKKTNSVLCVAASLALVIIFV